MTMQNTRPGGRAGGAPRRALSLVLAAGTVTTGLIALAPASAAADTATTTAAAAGTVRATAAGSTVGAVESWTRVSKKHPNSAYWKSADALRAGNEGGAQGLSRSFLQLGTANLKGADVTAAILRVRNTAAATCTAKPVELWSVDPVSATTTWKNQPAKGAKLATVTAAKGRPGCAAGDLEFDVTALLKDAAATNRTAVTVGLFAADENDTSAWKRFDPKSAVLETTVAPAVPVTPAPVVSGLRTDPATACTGGLIGNTSQVKLFATVDSPATGWPSAEFQVFRADTGALVRAVSVQADSNRIATLAVPDTDLPTGDYTWNVRGVAEGAPASAWSPSCAFSVDRTRPGTPPVISSAEFPSADNGQPEHTGTARTPGTFTFTGGAGDTDLAEIVYWTDADQTRRSVAPGGSAVITPLSAGPQSVHAYSVDKAGNLSDTAHYLFVANRAPKPDAAGDLNGDGHGDLWTLDAAGRLLFRAGKGDGTFAAPTDAGVTLDAGSQIVASGDWGQDGYNDLVVLAPGDGGRKLWVYPNTGLGAVDTLNRFDLSVLDEANAHWADADQVTSAGDLDGDGAPELLVRQGAQLWLYYGSASGYVDWVAPVAVGGSGGSGWEGLTVVAPGDTDGDGLADLWVRDDATGELFAVRGSAGADGTLDTAGWGSGPRTAIGSGLTRAAYPTLGTSGDLTGDARADLTATTAHGAAVYFRATDTGIESTPVTLN
ncbi:DNRLRE domain-containing protein [Streptomyces sp. NBC_01408]|uniref:DNRLRE domain-containing protein n=1 Tax=Streptomyces sp. NBC_01408 TaxID=2903855 RepID=UPI002252596E|nr:DNRLRE domain-containing protein [Streptomyces sp. NBC_01408]MCX4691797.1 DNRLRE domain-containing protein [Streptomyces sp. NBC_01408]